MSECSVNDYFLATEKIQEEFENKKPRFVTSVIIYGSVVRGEIIPGLSDINVMLFTRKKNLSAKELETLQDINEDVVKQTNLKIVFRIHPFSDLSHRSHDLYFPFLYDLVLNNFLVYGKNIDPLLMDTLKAINNTDAVTEIKSTINTIKEVFYEVYLLSDKYKMGDSIYDLYRILQLFEVPCPIKIDYLIKKKEYSQAHFKKLFGILNRVIDNLDYDSIYSSIISRKLLCGVAKGIILVNKDNKKILLLQDKNGWWSFPKGGKTPNENTKKTIRREVLEETGIRELELLSPIGTTTHWYKTKSGDIRKTTSEFYLALTPEKRISLSPEHKAYRWVSVKQAEKLLTAQNQRYLVSKIMEKYQ